MHSWRYSILLLSLVATFLLKTAAQENSLFFERFSRDDGLSQNSVYAITQDHLDFIWIGTGKGLNRFDGYSFETYYNNFKDTNSISSSRVLDIKADRFNRLWLATDGGLNVFIPEKESFISFHHNINDSTSLSGERIKCLLFDNRGFLWVGTRSGLNVTNEPIKSLNNINTLKFKRINANLLGNKIITNLLEDKNGNIWAGTTSGLFEIDLNTWQTRSYFPAEESSEFLPGNQITALVQDISNTIWVGTQNGLYTINSKTKIFTSLKEHLFFKNNIRANSISSLLIDHLGGLWIGTSDNGLLQYDGTHFIAHVNNESNLHSLANNHAFFLFEDKFNNLFVSNFAAGFSITNITKKKFNRYLNKPLEQDILKKNDVRTIFCLDSSNLLLGIQNEGIYQLNIYNGTFKHNPLSKLKEKNLLPTIKTIFRENDELLWLGTLKQGLILYNERSGKIEEFKFPENDKEIRIHFVFDIKKDLNGDLWIASWSDGLFKLSADQKKWTRYKNIAEDEKSLSNNNLTSVYVDDENKIWVTSWGGGLSVLNQQTQKFDHYQMNRGNKNSLISNFCTDLYVDKKGLFWIGTIEGLCSYDVNKKLFRRFDGKQHIFNEIVFSIEEDKNENLWVSSDLGLSRFSKNSLSVTNFGIRDGIPGNKHYIGASCQLPDGRFTFGSRNGLYIFHPDSISTNIHNTPVHITNFQLSYKDIKVNKTYKGQIILNKSILLTDTLYLSHENNVLSFEYSVCRFIKPQSVQYAFMLEGFETDWNYVSSNKRVATYTNLNPGEYILKIKATNEAGIWNKQVKKLHIVIESPLWKTPAFLLILFFLFVITGLVVFRLRTKFLIKKKELLEKEIEARTRTIYEKNIQLAVQREESIIKAEELRSVTEQLQYLNNQLESEVTDRTKDLKSALIKAEDAKNLISSFLSNMSHELRTPMNAISGFSQLISCIDITEIEKKKYVEIINSNIEMLLTLIDNVMDVAKLHTNQYRFKKSSFLFSDLCEELIQKLKANEALVKENVDFVFKSENMQHIEIYSDPKAFRLIIFNLLENALKYTVSGKVVFSFSLLGDHSSSSVLKPHKKGEELYLKIKVSDTGVGIKKQHQEYIFDAFKKLDQGKKKLYRGTGLGLALVKNLTDRLYGKIDLKSKLNKGTTIVISIPLSAK